MTTKPTIPAAIIEKAARAQYEYDQSESDWEREGPAYKQLYRDCVIAALSAVYADIQAEAWRQAAEAIDLPGSDATGYYASEQHSGYLDAQQHAAEWLRTRADEMDGGKP